MCHGFPSGLFLFQHHLLRNVQLRRFLPNLHIVSHCFDFCNCKQVLLANHLSKLTLRMVRSNYVTLT